MCTACSVSCCLPVSTAYLWGLRKYATFCPLPHCFPVLFSGSKKWIILDGQHKYSAVKLLRERALEAGVEPPSWTSRFRCKKLYMRTTKEVREKIAGREQARTKTVKQQSVSDFCTAIQRELQRMKDDLSGVGTVMTYSKGKVLRDVYMKCGCNPKMDGTVVCIPLIPLHSVSHIVPSNTHAKDWLRNYAGFWSGHVE